MEDRNVHAKPVQVRALSQTGKEWTYLADVANGIYESVGFAEDPIKAVIRKEIELACQPGGAIWRLINDRS